MAKRYSVPESSTALKAALKAAFPGTKFSVKLIRGTAYGWVAVSWTDGPSEGDIQGIAHPFKGERWNSLEGYRETIPNDYSLCGVICHRTETAEQ